MVLDICTFFSVESNLYRQPPQHQHSSTDYHNNYNRIFWNTLYQEHWKEWGYWRFHTGSNLYCHWRSLRLPFLHFTTTQAFNDTGLPYASVIYDNTDIINNNIFRISGPNDHWFKIRRWKNDTKITPSLWVISLKR